MDTFVPQALPIAPPRSADQAAQDKALFAAAAQGDLAAARKAIEAGAWIDARDRQDCTPLVRALRAKAIPLANFLIEEGASLDVVTSTVMEPRRDDPQYVTEVWSRTPLTFAIDTGDEKLVAEMLAQGAEPNLSGHGHTPLGAAVRQSLRMTLLLLEHGAEPNQLIAERDHACSPLMLAAGTGDIERVQLLLRYGAKLDVGDYFFPEGSTKLQRYSSVYMYAARSNNVALLRFLEQQGEDIRFTDGEGNNALVTAAFYGAPAAVDHLVKLGVTSARAVAAAERYGHPDIAARLRAAGMK
jgi:ankyrin repeat protein